MLKIPDFVLELFKEQQP